jgi:hypothetical protein
MENPRRPVDKVGVATGARRGIRGERLVVDGGPTAL